MKMDNNTSYIWLVGTGLMAKEYAKILIALNKPFITIGRGEKNAILFENEFKTIVHKGGILDFLKTTPKLPSKVIVSVGIEALAETAKLLLDYGVLEILLEKPGIGYPKEIIGLIEKISSDAKVVLAYNRRFYSSVIKARELIEMDGGVQSFFFEFTEWSHTIKDLKKHPAEHNNWFLGNSTHVIDTAFYLCGKPIDISTYYNGSLDWHPTSSNFAGSGITDKNALFSYIANWQAPGRWAIEIMTSKHRLILRPMEKLFIQEIGSVQVSPVDLVDEHMDIEFKPGLYKQTVEFLNGNYQDFCDVREQYDTMNIYLKMSGYTYD